MFSKVRDIFLSHRNATLRLSYTPHFPELDPDLTLNGPVIFNPFTGKFIADAADVASGLVSVSGPGDFSGNKTLEFTAVSQNIFFETNSTGILEIPLEFFPVADGPSITATATSLDATATGLPEDTNFTVDIRVNDIDVDGSETVGGWVILEVGAGFEVFWSIVGLPGPPTAQVLPSGTVNGFNLTLAEAAALTFFPIENFSGDIPISVTGFTQETLDPNEILFSTSSFSFTVDAIPDFANLTTTTLSVPEFTQTAIPGLAAELIDQIGTAEGTDSTEQLSVKFTNVPAGSQFFLSGSSVQYGGFIAPGVYSIPDPAELPNLEFRGPQFVSGTFDVTLEAVTFEDLNFLEELTTETFQIVIAPVASDFLILSEDITIGASGREDLVLNARVLDQNGGVTGEDPVELIELTFDLTDLPDVDAGYINPKSGGSLKENGAGTVIFRGTQEQANDLEFVRVTADPSSGRREIGVTALTVDQGDVGIPGTDDFPFEITFQALDPAGIAETTMMTLGTFVGTDGNDFIRTTASLDQAVDGGDGDDVLVNSAGIKTFTGGAGADTFIFKSDTDSLNVITDFSVGENDKINVSDLLVDFNPQRDDINDFVEIDTGAGIVLRVSPTGNGVFQDVVSLPSNPGTPQSLFASGNLLI